MFFGGELPRTKTWKVGSPKNVNLNLLSFKRRTYDNLFWTISLGDLNIILGAWNGFSANCHACCDRLFFSKTKIFENMALGHVNEVPAWKLEFVSNISSMVAAAKTSSIYRTAFSVKQKYSVTKITQPCNDDVITIHWWWCHHQISLNWIGGTSEPSQAAPMALNRYYSHLNKSRILKNLNLRKKVDCNFRGNLLKNHFRHLKLY